MRSVTGRRVAVIGVASSAGTHHAGQDRAPAALRAAGFTERLRAAGLTVEDRGGGIEPGLVVCLPDADITRCVPMDMPAICQSVRHGTPRSTSQLPMRSRL